MTSQVENQVFDTSYIPCENCLKRAALCVCEDIKPQPSKLRVLFLQHPQEPDKELGTAWIAHKSLSNSKFRIGLSWPNLAKALGEATDPKRWAALYLGSATCAPGLSFVDAKGKGVAEERKPRVLDGIVVLDGTWSQAKTLWWRNAWLLKLHRMVLNPSEPSKYGRLRKEPRRESLSTIESVAQVLSALGESKEFQSQLLLPFETLLKKYREDRATRQR